MAYEELSNCQLCEWRCGVNRNAGEMGVCMLTEPQVASRMLHPAPPSSYTIFMAGCNFRCLHCQNYDIAHWPVTGAPIEGRVSAEYIARRALEAIGSPQGRYIAADRLFFSGGEPTCSLPFVEEVVWHARRLDPKTKVNFDTNGFMTEDSLRRVLSWTTSVTFDLRAVDDDVHRALTGAPAEPVLRNARIMAEHPEKLWEFRILVIPGINEGEIEGLCRFIADIDPNLPVLFLAFRPNFVLDHHPGATLAAMRRAVEIGRSWGLKRVDWAGHPGLPAGPEQIKTPAAAAQAYSSEGARIAASYAIAAGCVTHPRDCGACTRRLDCSLKAYRPFRRT